VLAGLLAGLVIGSAGESEPSLQEAVSSVEEEVQPALSQLELVSIEYSEAVRGGKVVSESEYEGARSHVEGVMQTLDSSREDLELLAPAELAAADRALEELATQVDNRVPAPVVEAAVASAEEAVRAAIRADQPAA
jgi:hypothetical protein